MAKLLGGNFPSRFVRPDHRQGDGVVFLMCKGTFTPGHALTIDADGSVIDAGFPLSGVPTSETYFTFIFAGDSHLNFSGGVDRWNALTDWVVANKASENIQAFFNTGDYSLSVPATDLANAWSNGSPAKGLVNIDGLGIPWATAVGNHDYNSNSPSGRNTALFDTNLGYARLSGKSWFVGYYDDGANSKATYAIRFTVGSYTFLVIALELYPRIGAMQWALDTLQDYPTDYGIILTHAYLNSNGAPCVDGSTYGPNTYSVGADLSGEEMWSYLITRPNVMLVKSGHFLATPRAAFLESTGSNGNKTRAIFTNYQELSPSENGLVKLRFSPADGLVYVSDIDLETGAAAQITPYSFSFDAPAADSQGPAISGVVPALSGTEATITWNTDELADSQVEYGETAAYGSETVLDASMVLSHSVVLPGLSEGQAYHYRVKSRDAAGNLAVSNDRTFSCASASHSRAVASGVSGYVDFGNSPDFAQLGNISVGFWAKLSSNCDNDDVFAQYGYDGETESVNTTFYLALAIVSGSLDVCYIHEYGGGTNSQYIFNANIPSDSWCYLGISRDSVAKTVTMYLKPAGGAISLVGTYSYTNQPTGGGSVNSTLRLFHFTNFAGRYLDGAQMSNFTYHSRCLSQLEHDAQAGGTVDPLGLLLWAPLGQGTPEPDWSGNGHSGVVSNATISEDGPPI